MFYNEIKKYHWHINTSKYQFLKVKIPEHFNLVLRPSISVSIRIFTLWR